MIIASALVVRRYALVGQIASAFRASDYFSLLQWQSFAAFAKVARKDNFEGSPADFVTQLELDKLDTLEFRGRGDQIAYLGKSGEVLGQLHRQISGIFNNLQMWQAIKTVGGELRQKFTPPA